MHNVLMIVLAALVQSSAYAASTVRMMGGTTKATESVMPARAVTNQVGTVRKSSLPVVNKQTVRAMPVTTATTGDTARLTAIPLTKSTYKKNNTSQQITGGTTSTTTNSDNTELLARVARLESELDKVNGVLNNIQLDKEDNKWCDVVTGVEMRDGALHVQCGRYKTGFYKSDGNLTEVKFTIED